MLILDSDHLRALSAPGERSEKLKAKLLEDGREIVTTIINVYEGIKGYFSEINKAHDKDAGELQKASAFSDLSDLLDYYTNWTILRFDAAAEDQFVQLKRHPKCRIVKTTDLQIAAIALCHDATVLTSDSAHFGRVPNLKFEDWLLDEPLEEPNW